MFNPLKGCELQRFMGEQQIHHFFGGFARKEITTLKQLKATPLEEIIAICGEMKMPRAAIDRLLEASGIRSKKTPDNKTPATTTPAAATARAPAAKKQDKPEGQKDADEGPTEPATTTDSEDKTTPKDPDSVNSFLTGYAKSVLQKSEEKTKTQASSYYHFASTPAEQAAKFKPKQVEKPTDVKWQKAEGASAWNPGNTFEERNYTSIANGRFEEMMKDFKWPGTNLKVKSVSNSNLDFSIISVRGKIKYIYDMSFSLEFHGKIGDDSVKGTVEMSDIMPDDEPDEWEWSVNMKKNNAAHKAAQSLVDAKKELVIGNVKLIIAELKARYGPS